MGEVLVGCAGWSLPRALQPGFPEGDSHLHRYASRFPVTEINSSFHRPHARTLYGKWAGATPPEFRFCAKLPRAITHERRLVDCEAAVMEFLGQAGALGGKLACLLVQLPPSFAFDCDVATAFLAMLRERFHGDVALEPRHATWFDPPADTLLRSFRVARVLADPVRHEPGRAPGGFGELVYLRLHGSPRMYYSAYEPQVIAALAARLQLAATHARAVWCVFDNTASGAAVGNALQLQQALAALRPPGP